MGSTISSQNRYRLPAALGFFKSFFLSCSNVALAFYLYPLILGVQIQIGEDSRICVEPHDFCSIVFSAENTRWAPTASRFKHTRSLRQSLLLNKSMMHQLEFHTLLPWILGSLTL